MHELALAQAVDVCVCTAEVQRRLDHVPKDGVPFLVFMQRLAVFCCSHLGSRFLMQLVDFLLCRRAFQDPSWNLWL